MSTTPTTKAAANSSTRVLPLLVSFDQEPRIRQMLVSGPLEYIVDAPKARALALKRLSPVAQGYMESLCE